MIQTKAGFIKAHRRLNVVCALLLIWAVPGYSTSYDVEIIIFEHVRNTNVGSSNTLLLPVVKGAKRIPQDADPTSPIQPLPELRLQAEAARISASGDHRLVYHGGWRQPDYDEETAPFMRIAMGSSVPMLVERGTPDSQYLTGYAQPPLNTTERLTEARSTTIYGGIKVWVGRFLHFDTHLAYTPRGGSRSFAMQQDRRMRSRQLHYLDNPRMGIITKIFPVDETAPN